MNSKFDIQRSIFIIHYSIIFEIPMHKFSYFAIFYTILRESLKTAGFHFTTWPSRNIREKYSALSDTYHFFGLRPVETTPRRVTAWPGWVLIVLFLIIQSFPAGTFIRISPVPISFMSPSNFNLP